MLIEFFVEGSSHFVPYHPFHYSIWTFFAS